MDPNTASFLVALAAGGLASIAGGVVGGLATGADAIGKELAMIMGAFYGPLAGVSGVMLGAGAIIWLI